MLDFTKIQKFNWDRGNIKKNWLKHQVTPKECEEVFFNNPPIIFYDKPHLEKEIRFVVLGQTNKQHLLTIVFSVRKNKIRIISAREMSRKERKTYEKQS